MISRVYSKSHKCPKCKGRIILEWTFNENMAMHVGSCENYPARCDYQSKTGFKVIEFD